MLSSKGAGHDGPPRPPGGSAVGLSARRRGAGGRRAGTGHAGDGQARAFQVDAVRQYLRYRPPQVGQHGALGRQGLRRRPCRAAGRRSSGARWRESAGCAAAPPGSALGQDVTLGDHVSYLAERLPETRSGAPRAPRRRPGRSPRRRAPAGGHGVPGVHPVTGLDQDVGRVRGPLPAPAQGAPGNEGPPGEARAPRAQARLGPWQAPSARPARAERVAVTAGPPRSGRSPPPGGQRAPPAVDEQDCG